MTDTITLKQSEEPMIKVLGDRVLVRLQEAEESVTKGGIVMPGSLKKTDSKGTVIAVGPGRLNTTATSLEPVRWPLEVKVGDTIVFGPNAGADFDYNGEKLKVLNESEIFAILKGEK